jgi:PhnB protein
MPLNPCLYFTGNAEEALAHYRSALGGDVTIARYEDAPQLPDAAPPEWKNKVMYGSLQSALGIVACMDAPPGRAGKPGNNFSISVQTQTEAQADAAFAKLAEGGSVTMPPSKTFFAEKFAMVDDKFGVTWMIGYNVGQS